MVGAARQVLKRIRDRQLPIRKGRGCPSGVEGKKRPRVYTQFEHIPWVFVVGECGGLCYWQAIRMRVGYTILNSVRGLVPTKLAL